ncbi:MAG: TerC family protein, partial [bacterium]|nr:TerC family protein [Candidatus Aquidulcis sp.]
MGGNELFSPLGIGFGVFLIAALAIDFGLLRKNGTHVVPVKEAAAWTLVWIVLAIIFGIAMQFYWGDGTKTTEYFVGYLVEKSLSVDNIFVFTLIFAALKTPKKLQQLALMWGILLALLLRGIMILIGAALIERFEWIIWFFGAFLLFTGVQMLRGGGHANENEPSAIKLARRFIHVNNDYNEERFWVMKAGKRVFTPIFLTIAVIGIIDLVFAVDSIPAIFGITLDPFIVFTSNAFAILGLRNLYFLLADAKDRFHYLSAGLAFVLMWIGVKMILPAISTLRAAVCECRPSERAGGHKRHRAKDRWEVVANGAEARGCDHLFRVRCRLLRRSELCRACHAWLLPLSRGHLPRSPVSCASHVSPLFVEDESAPNYRHGPR